MFRMYDDKERSVEPVERFVELTNAWLVAGGSNKIAPNVYLFKTVLQLRLVIQRIW